MALCPSCGQANPEGFRFCGACGRPLRVDAGAGVRKTVTIVFCDVTGSTALGESVDPEALRGLLARYFERVKGIVELHGGTVEKFIGDAVMAVFGVPVAHEDDALRAVRAATVIRAALPELGIRARIGVMSGEVVAGTEERLATGDAVNVAARLEQAAQPGEVLIGEPTLVLVRGAADVEGVEPLVLKGKAQPVAAYRLLRVREAPPVGGEAPFVGRTGELALLAAVWERVRAERRCQLATIVGEAGVGKSRLVTELLRTLGAQAVHGRCLPYGDGITYWPVVEMLKQLRVLPRDEIAAAAIRSLLGEAEATVRAEEIAWAVRKTLEQAAGERSLAVVFDDIHWGEPTFLDLVEHIALLASGAPILLLCLARPELLDLRPAWPVALRLKPLPDEAVEQLIPARITGELRMKIARAAGGNPLFIGEIVTMAAEGDGELVVPPTLQALLTARLDQLGGGERRVLQRGAVEGEIFHRGAVQALAPDERQVTRRLVELVRKGLIKPDASQLPGEDAFRFRHLLIRDAAYDALPKAARVKLHERFGTWLEERGTTMVELDEIVGYHLERAVCYRGELGLPDDRDLRASARRHLTAAGRRARARQDYRAAARLLERAAALVPPCELDVVLELELTDALFWGNNGTEALRRARAVAERAAAAGDRIGELCGRIQEGFLRSWLESEAIEEQQLALIEEALPVFEAAGDHFALSLAYGALAQVANHTARFDRMVEACERAAACAERTGLADRFVRWRSFGRFYGTTPVTTLLAWQDEQDERARRNPHFRGFRAWALAMLGRIDEGRALLAGLRAELTERGPCLPLGGICGHAGIGIELLAADPAAAVDLGEAAARLLDELGQPAILSTTAGYLARAYYEFGRLDEADAWATRSAELGASDDAQTQMLWRQARAKVLARRGEAAEAERLGREAVMLSEETEMLNAQADAYADLGEVLSLTGHTAEAVRALEEALARYERKENLVMAKRIPECIAALDRRHAARRPATAGP